MPVDQKGVCDVPLNHAGLIDVDIINVVYNPDALTLTRICGL
jgi:hypothetical protein